MTNSKSLVALARRILDEAEKVEGSNGNSRPTGALFEATQELQLSILTAPQLLEQHQVHYQSLSCLGWLVKFDIFNHVPSDLNSIPYTDLAAKAGVPTTRLQSVARMAMTSGLFIEPSPTQIAHSQLSAAFAADSSLQDWALFMTQYSAPMASKLAEATARWGETTAKHETAFNVAFDTELPFFDYVKAKPGLAEMFAGYMRSMGQSESGRLQHLVDGFDWTALGEASIVDVGGSTAHASIALASAFPRLQFTIQDLPEVVQEGPAILAPLENTVASRIRFAVHDFFTPQPPVDEGSAPDIYLLRKILHDWPAELAQKILQHLAVALRENGNPRARVVVMDTILPPPGTIGPVQEAALRVRDLTMAQGFNSKERELVEWEQLFASTNPPLKLTSWKQPARSCMAVMELALER
jgi:hypothetical protein